MAITLNREVYLEIWCFRIPDTYPKDIRDAASELRRLDGDFIVRRRGTRGEAAQGRPDRQDRSSRWLDRHRLSVETPANAASEKRRRLLFAVQSATNRSCSLSQ